MRQTVLLAIAVFIFAVPAFPQGLDTAATKDDWEEINFAFDRDVLTDGYPSLLRLAELLEQHPDYRVRLVGHTDHLGSDGYNERLSRARAETVKAFLVKYGARDGQITVEARGKGAPKSAQRNDAGRWMNRRVEITVLDGEGNVVSAGGVGDAINAMEELLKKQEECCNKILDKLDEVLALLKDLKDENDRLKEDIAELQQKHGDLKQDVGALPKPPSKEEVAQAVQDSMPKPKRFSVLNFNVGPDTEDGNVTFTGKGRVFLPFAGNHALQAEGEFLHFFGRDEGQVDVGLVNRFGNVQFGGFASFKSVKLDQFQSAGSLGQAAFTLDYVFNRGRVGFFGTKRFHDGSVVNSVALGPNVIEETYLRVIEQVGFSTAFSVWGDAWVEGNIGAMFRTGGSNEPGGTWRLVQPIARNLALTFEGGFNETLISNDTTGRFVVGLQIGKWLAPKDYGMQGDSPVPADIPRIRYEVLRRQVRTGNDLPVADAGPDLIGVEPGPVTLDGSASFDPDDDPLTFSWQQIGGPPVTLSGADTAQASFTAEEGENYHFRLTVRDGQGGVGTDRVTVSARGVQDVEIIRFSADPQTVEPGGRTTLVWEIQNAESAEISGLGDVDPSAGTQQVVVNETTTYTLTARNASGEVSRSVTVNVDTPEVRILRFTATPDQIEAGESSVLAWETQNAGTVTIEGIGPVAASGTTTVSPETTTTFRLTASNAAGSVTQTATVTVRSRPAPPTINVFEASPAEIDAGGEATLTWEVQNAGQVSITGLGVVDPSGSRAVTPSQTTSYTLTASNEAGQVSASVTVTVQGDGGGAPGDGFPRIVRFDADPLKIKKPGDPTTLSWETEGAETVEIVGIGPVNPSGSVMVRPYEETTYTLVAYGGGRDVTATVTVLVEIPNRAPIARAFAERTVSGQETGSSVFLDGSASEDPDGDPLTYTWRNVGERAAEIRGASNPTATAVFQGGFGEYVFELEVRDDKGLRDFARVRVRLVDLGAPPNLLQ